MTTDNQSYAKSTMYIIPCTRDMREDLQKILGKEIMLSVDFDKWNNYLILETIKASHKKGERK